MFDKSADQSNGDSQETLLIFVFHLTKDCVKELAEIIFQVAAEEDEIMRRDVLKMVEHYSHLLVVYKYNFSDILLADVFLL